MPAMSEPQRYRFPRSARIRSKTDFDRIFAARRRASDARLALYMLENELGETRLGIAVGRRYGNAVQRNAVKRRIREAFRLMRAELPAGLDLVVMPHPGVCPKPVEIQESLRTLVPRLMRTRKPREVL